MTQAPQGRRIDKLWYHHVAHGIDVWFRFRNVAPWWGMRPEENKELGIDPVTSHCFQSRTSAMAR